MSGKSVITPAGTSIDSVVPLNMDSTLAADRKLWLMGGTGTLAPGATSAARNLTFLVKSPVTKGSVTFVSQGEEIVSVPATAPDTVPAWVHHDSSYTDSGRGLLKRAISVRFKSSATQRQRQSGIDQVGGLVVGGYSHPSGEGVYLVVISESF